MNVTLEISLYPLDQRYGDTVISFIGLLKSQPGIKARTNSISTLVTGQFADVWQAVQVALDKTFQEGKVIATVFKILNQELELEWQKL